MVEFPIFEEIKNFVYTNLESIFLVIVPFATLVGWLAERNSKKLTSIEETGMKLIADLKDEICKRDKRFAEHEREFNEFKVQISKDVGILKVLVMKDFEDYDKNDDPEFYVNKRKRRNTKVG